MTLILNKVEGMIEGTKVNNKNRLDKKEVIGLEELITIVVPVYKVEKYLALCVDSLLKQTYQNLEIILVNDGSPDNSGEICDKYIQKDNRIKVIHKENGGLADARNVGIDHAKGTYITFVDSDDWLHYEYIKRLYDLIQNTEADISVCSCIKTTTEENVEIDTSKENIYRYSNVEALNHLEGGEFNMQMAVAWGKLYKKSLFESIRFPFGRVHEDIFVAHKLLYMAKRIVLTTLPLIYYRQREDSIMGVGFHINHLLDRIDAQQERIVFLTEVGLVDLRNKSYRKLFHLYREFYRNKTECYDRKNREDVISEFRSLKKELRNSKQVFKFKIFYELYYISPKTIDLLCVVKKKLKQYLKK